MRHSKGSEPDGLLAPGLAVKSHSFFFGCTMGHAGSQFPGLGVKSTSPCSGSR